MSEFKGFAVHRNNLANGRSTQNGNSNAVPDFLSV